MAGRPRKTKEQKAIQGTLRPAREQENAMQPDKLEGVPVPPDDLDQIGQRTWFVTATQLHELGVLSGLDLTMLKEYCYQVSIMEQAKKEIKENGLTVIMTNKGGGMYPVKSPYISIYNEALTHANRLAQQYGLTPSSRQKISANPKKEEKADPWADL